MTSKNQGGDVPRKTMFVENLEVNSTITSIFIVRDKEIRQQKNNNQDYLRLTLGDRTSRSQAGGGASPLFRADGSGLLPAELLRHVQIHILGRFRGGAWTTYTAAPE